MSMRKCEGCPRTARQFGRAILVAEDGTSRSALVCRNCLGRAIKIVATTKPTIVKQEAPRDGLLDKAIRMINTYRSMTANTSPLLTDPTTKEHFIGKTEGLDVALETLKKIQAGEA